MNQLSIRSRYTNDEISEPEGTHKPALVKQLRDSKRRIVQQMMECVGKADASMDTEYLQLKARHVDLYKHVKDTMVHVKNYMNTLVALGYECSVIGNDSVQLVEADSNNTMMGKSETEFSRSMQTIEFQARDTADNNMVHIIELFQSKLDDMKDLRKQMEHREALKLDYDSARRKLRVVKDKGMHADVSRREIKLKLAEDALYACTNAITKRFENYEKERATLLDMEMNMFRKSQAQLFMHCASLFDKSVTLKQPSVKGNENNQSEDDDGRIKSAAECYE